MRCECGSERGEVVSVADEFDFRRRRDYGVDCGCGWGELCEVGAWRMERFDVVVLTKVSGRYGEVRATRWVSRDAGDRAERASVAIALSCSLALGISGVESVVVRDFAGIVARIEASRVAECAR